MNLSNYIKAGALTIALSACDSKTASTNEPNGGGQATSSLAASNKIAINELLLKYPQGAIFKGNNGKSMTLSLVAPCIVIDNPQLHLEDIDGDGNADIITTTKGSRKTTIEDKNGDGKFDGIKSVQDDEIVLEVTDTDGDFIIDQSKDSYDSEPTNDPGQLRNIEETFSDAIPKANSLLSTALSVTLETGALNRKQTSGIINENKTIIDQLFKLHPNGGVVSIGQGVGTFTFKKDNSGRNLDLQITLNGKNTRILDSNGDGNIDLSSVVTNGIESIALDENNDGKDESMKVIDIETGQVQTEIIDTDKDGEVDTVRTRAGAESEKVLPGTQNVYQKELDKSHESINQRYKLQLLKTLETIKK